MNFKSIKRAWIQYFSSLKLCFLKKLKFLKKAFSKFFNKKTKKQIDQIFKIKNSNLKKFFQKLFLNLSKIFRFLSSLKYAVLNLVALAFLSGMGTFIESYHTLELAQLLIYKSVWMKLALISLSLNVGCVLVDRWPWKKRHISFVMAHIGILMMVVGSWITQVQGVDGSMRLEPNKESSVIHLPSKIFVVYASSDGSGMKEIYRDQPLFVLNRPSEEKPYSVHLGSEQMEVVDFYPYATETFKFKPHPHEGWAVQFLLEGPRARHSDWIYQSLKKSSLDRRSSFVQKKIGQASLVLSDGSYTFTEPNELILEYRNETTVFFKLRKRGRFIRAGELKVGDSLNTGWMNLKFKILNSYKAEVVSEFQKEKTQTDSTVSALKIRYNQMEKWIRVNTPYYFYKDNFVYIVSYMNQMVSVGSSFTLKQFNITRYPNSTQAKEYESVVQIQEGEVLEKEFENKEKTQVTISMNRPLKHKGWSFYQSGFEEDEWGQIKASILAVNKDPGRYLKYFGGVLIVLGILALFCLKRR